MSNLLKWCLMLFSAGLGVAVAYRMSAEAMAVVIGVVCGVLASVVMSVLILAVTRRRPDREPEPAYPNPAQPPVIVIAPPGYQAPAISPPRPHEFDRLPVPSDADFVMLGQNSYNEGR